MRSLDLSRVRLVALSLVPAPVANDQRRPSVSEPRLPRVLAGSAALLAQLQRELCSDDLPPSRTGPLA